MCDLLQDLHPYSLTFKSRHSYEKVVTNLNIPLSGIDKLEIKAHKDRGKSQIQLCIGKVDANAHSCSSREWHKVGGGGFPVQPTLRFEFEGVRIDLFIRMNEVGGLTHYCLRIF